MTPREHDHGRRAPVVDPLQRFRFGHGWVDPYTRCVACHDPCRPGWTLCDRCHAHAHPTSPVAVAYVKRQRHIEERRTMSRTMRSVVRRLQIIENALCWGLLDASARDADWQTR